MKPVILRPSIFDAETVTAAFTTRHGGSSEQPFDSLNLGLSTGDEADIVLRNRIAALAEIGLSAANVAYAGQVHGHHIESVTEPGLYRQTDGLVTATPGLALAITAADCAAVLLADSDASVIGACHAGWRGAVAGIVESTVQRMEALGASAGAIRAYVSPCIGAENFEVGPEVAAAFSPAFVRNAPDSDRAYVDLKADIRDRLVRSGLSSDAIEVSPHCTVRARGDFFSHRADNGRTGRMMGFIALVRTVA